MTNAPTTRPTTILAALAMLGAVACGDSGGSTPRDSAPASDRIAFDDGTSGAGDQNCAQSLGCLVDCGKQAAAQQAACLQACADRSCSEARGALGEIQTCVTSTCASECAAGGKPCNDCLGAKCARALFLCSLNICPGQTAPTLNCGASSLCVAACGGDGACVAQCEGARCASAAQLAGDVSTCTSSSCAAQCATPGQTCTDCLTANCAKPLALCGIDRCPGEAPANLNCGELSACQLSCGDDSSCTSACDAAACAAARAARDAIVSCLGSSCKIECLIPSLPACGDCLKKACQSTFDACGNQRC